MVADKVYTLDKFLWASSLEGNNDFFERNRVEVFKDPRNVYHFDDATCARFTGIDFSGDSEQFDLTLEDVLELPLCSHCEESIILDEYIYRMHSSVKFMWDFWVASIEPFNKPYKDIKPGDRTSLSTNISNRFESELAVFEMLASADQFPFRKAAVKLTKLAKTTLAKVEKYQVSKAHQKFLLAQAGISASSPEVYNTVSDAKSLSGISFTLLKAFGVYQVDDTVLVRAPEELFVHFKRKFTNFVPADPDVPFDVLETALRLKMSGGIYEDFSKAYAAALEV